MKFIEFINFEKTAAEEIRSLIRDSSIDERIIEWHVGLRNIVSRPHLALICAANIHNPWVIKKLANFCSAQCVALYGVDKEIMGLPFVSVDDTLLSLMELMGSANTFRPAPVSGMVLEKTCPMAISSRKSQWVDLSPPHMFPSYL
ncbi:hypothetical protein [Rhodoferax aquaticus]|uniref:Uncharacterized protein n=1 Tax=Rhodoferax aquaticus TaxID=2527691 RepID=A0A515ESY4_9BURK|nr:hypothetical protein [Rhodoferax aquaticus]QDL55775.1 hypothetical protein EXZ61_17230 [Rhodoferax aquaticus]